MTKILTYHVLAGKFDSTAIAGRIRKGRGTAKFKTVNGDTLTATMQGKDLVLRDEKGAPRGFPSAMCSSQTESFT